MPVPVLFFILYSQQGLQFDECAINFSTWVCSGMLTIFSDDVLENVEEFLVQLNTDDPNTSIGQGSVTVSILDNNGNLVG